MKKIYLKFTNGLSFAAGVQDILSPLSREYDFVESEDPEFIVFGPYGRAVYPLGSAVRVGYYCENFLPDMTVCDWAFGMPYEEEVRDSRYMRIQWHEVNPEDLIRTDLDAPERLLGRKAKFCNFIYSNTVPYRERFFRELSKYKRIDAPGRSMNNMAGIDANSAGNIWQTKRRFLEPYKFTIAFENHSSSGYNTEKLLDPMLSGSLPIYFGNPRIGEHFNCQSFINGHDHVASKMTPLIGLLESWSKTSYKELRSRAGLSGRIQRKFRGVSGLVKMRLQAWDYRELIDHIIRVDKDDDLYLSYAAQPWFKGNVPPSNERTLQRWREIFSHASGAKHSSGN